MKNYYFSDPRDFDAFLIAVENLSEWQRSMYDYRIYETLICDMRIILNDPSAFIDSGEVELAYRSWCRGEIK